jgi:hypothetical protein
MHTILVGKPFRKCPPGRPRRWENKIQTDHKEMVSITHRENWLVIIFTAGLSQQWK